MKLYFSPGSCARVTAIALEEAGLEFEVCIVRLGQGQHKGPEFLAINPKGKVPALAINEQVLTENVAILSFLASTYPAANLLPQSDNAIASAMQIADLCFCGSTLHPIVTRLCIPRFFAEGDDAQASIKQQALETMRPQFALIEQRLKSGPWWYGDVWSIVDGYLFWIWSRVHGCGFPTDEFPSFALHARQSEERPSIQRALVREKAALEQLRQEGLAVMPAHPLK